MTSRRRRGRRPGTASSRPPKIQRWIDLVAALLRRRYGATFDELRREVPAYAHAGRHDSLLRMFERDKDELREFGVAIETVHHEHAESVSYVLRRRNFYLPYLEVAGASTDVGADRREAPPQPSHGARERAGYRDLPRVVLEPDELEALGHAAERVRGLGDPQLAEDVGSAIAKLGFDLRVQALDRLLRPWERRDGEAGGGEGPGGRRRE